MRVLPDKIIGRQIYELSILWLTFSNLSILERVVPGIPTALLSGCREQATGQSAFHITK
jgi:hypothetical protein